MTPVTEMADRLLSVADPGCSPLRLQSGVAFAAPETGWWWNASEKGRGFFIEMKGYVTVRGRLFLRG